MHTVIKVFVKCKILSVETSLSAYRHMHTLRRVHCYSYLSLFPVV